MIGGLNMNGLQPEVVRILARYIEALAASIDSEILTRLLLAHGLTASAKFTGERRRWDLWAEVFTLARPAWHGEVGAEQIVAAFDRLWDHLRSAAGDRAPDDVDAWTAIGATIAALATAQLVLLQRAGESLVPAGARSMAQGSDEVT